MMITIKCGQCNGVKGYNLGDIKVDCPHCFGSGFQTHASVADAVAVDATQKRTRKPKTKPVIEVLSDDLESSESA